MCICTLRRNRLSLFSLPDCPCISISIWTSQFFGGYHDFFSFHLQKCLFSYQVTASRETHLSLHQSLWDELMLWRYMFKEQILTHSNMNTESCFLARPPFHLDQPNRDNNSAHIGITLMWGWPHTVVALCCLPAKISSCRFTWEWLPTQFSFPYQWCQPLSKQLGIFIQIMALCYVVIFQSTTHISGWGWEIWHRTWDSGHLFACYYTIHFCFPIFSSGCSC